jgi:hypothetical protein
LSGSWRGYIIEESSILNYRRGIDKEEGLTMDTMIINQQDKVNYNRCAASHPESRQNHRQIRQYTQKYRA